MAQCAGATGIPVAVLKQAKKDGCPGFTSNSRVDLAQFLGWFFSRDADASVNWSDRLKRAQAMREEHRLDSERGKMIAKETVDQAAGEIMALLLGTLDRYSDELAPVLHGLGAAEIKSKLVGANERLKGDLRTKFRALG